ncbi:hypothetical protein EMGBS15_11800 [Filimonas sp.]|jgi:hypothetical protein|nr:hypothetical protein EMGBS15_11800 [Filimonas sp.]
MTKRALFVLLLLEIIGTSFAGNDDRQTILWSRNRPLVWSDFQGKLDAKIVAQNPVEGDQVIEDGNRTTIIHTEMDAYCYQQIEFMSKYYGDTVTYEVKTLFNVAKSWTNSTSDYILNHEQRHFDLGEVYARKLRKYLRDSLTGYESSVQNKIFTRYINENQEAQKRYDSLTNHSINSEAQLNYNLQIDSLLNAYEDCAAIQVKKYAPRKVKKK